MQYVYADMLVCETAFSIWFHDKFQDEASIFSVRLSYGTSRYVSCFLHYQTGNFRLSYISQKNLAIRKLKIIKNLHKHRERKKERGENMIKFRRILTRKIFKISNNFRLSWKQFGRSNFFKRSINSWQKFNFLPNGLFYFFQV